VGPGQLGKQQGFGFFLGQLFELGDLSRASGFLVI
jgi:hypothetical protein